MENKTKQGILVLIDVVNYTGQAKQAGDKCTAKYNKYFNETISQLACDVATPTLKPWATRPCCLEPV